MKKELKNKLEEMFSKPENQDKYVEVDGDTYIYSSIRNELRKHIDQDGQEIEQLIGCFLPDMKTLVTFREDKIL